MNMEDKKQETLDTSLTEGERKNCRMPRLSHIAWLQITG